jgi:hypothetical protein
MDNSAGLWIRIVLMRLRIQLKILMRIRIRIQVRGGGGQPKMCIPLGKILGTPLNACHPFLFQKNAELITLKGEGWVDLEPLFVLSVLDLCKLIKRNEQLLNIAGVLARIDRTVFFLKAD